MSIFFITMERNLKFTFTLFIYGMEMKLWMWKSTIFQFFFLHHYHNFVHFVRNNSDNRCLFRIIWLKFDNIACLLILTSFLTRILLLFFKFMGSLLTASPRKFLLRGSTYSMHYLNRSGNWNEMNTTLDTNENRYILGNTESVLKIYLYSLVTFMFRNRSKSRRTLQDYK